MGRPSDAKERLLQVAFQAIWSQSYGSVSVDQICLRARVKKGSFYHFFPSKSDLTVAALEEYWRSCSAQYEAAFSPELPPLQRIENFCELILQNQRERMAEQGQVLGCPFASLGSELSTQDEKVRMRTADIGNRICQFLERALADAASVGHIERQDYRVLARSIYSHVLGSLVVARINNDLDDLKYLKPNVLRLIGVRSPMALGALA